MKSLVLLALIIGLAGCGSNSPLAPNAPLVTLTAADLTAAIAEANAAADTQAVSCFTYIQTNLAALSSAAGGSVAPVGVFSAFEAVNLALSTGNAALSPASKTALENACGPLVLHAVNTGVNLVQEVQAIAGQLAVIK